MTSTSQGPHRVMARFTYLLGARWVREVLQAVFLILLARRYTTTYGQFMLAMSLGQIVLFVAEFGLNQHLASLLARGVADRTATLIEVSVIKGVLLLAAWAGMLGFMHWQGYEAPLRRLVTVIATGLALEALASTLFVVLRVDGRQDIEGRLRVAGALAGFGFGLATLWAGAPAVVVAFFKLIETAVHLGGALLATSGEARSAPRLRDVKLLWETWRGGMVFMLMAVAAILYNKLNVFFLQNAAGARAVAQYSATWQIVDGLSCLVSVLLLRDVLFPLFLRLAQQDHPHFRRLAADAARWLLAASLPAVFLLYVESDRLIPLIYGQGYGEAAWMQKILVVTVACAFLHNLAAYLMIAIQRERRLLAFHGFGLAFNVAACALLIPGMPLAGSALAMVLTKVLVAALTVWYCQRRLGFILRSDLLHTLAAAAAGVVLYLLGRTILPRLAADVVALLPMAVLALRWRRDQPHQLPRRAARTGEAGPTSD